MKHRAPDWFVSFALIAVAGFGMVVISRLLAGAGHPTAYWLWHDILGVL